MADQIYVGDVLVEQVDTSDKVADLDGRLLKGLAALGGQKVGQDAIEFVGTRIVLPAIYKNDMKGFVRFLRGYMESQEEETVFQRKFNFRPWDGANALRESFREVLGIDIVGKATYSFFGKNPPQLIDVAVDVNETVQVPWGACEVSLFNGSIHLDSINDPELGPLFHMSVNCPKKYASEVEGLFKMVEDHLHSHSIYRGKAFTGADQPEFLDVFATDPKKVIYNEATMADLDANIWTPIEHSREMRRMGIPLKRAVLLEGPWGTGKTLAANLTAQKCRENGWTYLYCRPGKDNIEDVMKTARLYQPAVVFFEDVDTISQDGNPESVTRLLDLFDGLEAKNNEVMVILTTNHVENIHQGMLRPGRLDGIIHIGALDDEARVRMIKSVVDPSLLAEDLDYDLINRAMKDYMPAYVREAIERTMRFAVARLDGEVVDVLTTNDFVYAAESLRSQFDLMKAAKEGTVPPTLDSALGSTIERQVEKVVGRTFVTAWGPGDGALRINEDVDQS